MGRYFSDVVEKAIEDLFYCYDNDRAKKAADRLAVAVEEQDDGDACFFLSCCYLGTRYNWTYHSFQEDEEAAYRLLGKGISLGSAAAVLSYADAGVPGDYDVFQHQGGMGGYP